MNRDEIIAMAKTAAVQHGHTYEPDPADGTVEFLASFAALVAEKVEARANERANESWKLMCKKMLDAEREVCARIVAGQWTNVAEKLYGIECAAAIRARGTKEGV